MDRGDRQTTGGYSPWGCKELNMTEESNIVGKTDAEAETPIVWPSDAKKWLIGKVPDAGKMKAEGEGDDREWVIGWHHRLNGHEFEQAPGVGDGQGGLVCCSPWGHRVRHDWAIELNLAAEYVLLTITRCKQLLSSYYLISIVMVYRDTKSNLRKLH